jgi:pyruvate/2-oxoglutarate dehydrogenase complex dihydrolipoamide dehydrogenase (E3) component
LALSSSIFVTLGVEVPIVDSRDRLMEFVDREIVETLTYHMRRQNMTLRLGEAVTKVFIDDHDYVMTELESGKRIVADTLLFSISIVSPSSCSASMPLVSVLLRSSTSGKRSWPTRGG